MNTMEQLFDKSKQLLMEKNYAGAVQCLQELTEKSEAFYQDHSDQLYSFNHVLETYYYAHFKKDVRRLSYTEYPVASFYRLLGFCQMHLDHHVEAIRAYKKALAWNPVDLDTMLQLAELYKKVHNLEEEMAITRELYSYCCTRATMARFYRNMGFYYLETMQVPMAAMLYQYSNIYYPTEHADRELAFLAKAMGNELPDYSLQEMQAAFDKENIPKGPDPDTIGITFRVGQLEMDAGNYDTAKECFLMVYDITQDKEVEELLRELEEKGV